MTGAVASAAGVSMTVFGAGLLTPPLLGAGLLTPPQWSTEGLPIARPEG